MNEALSALGRASWQGGIAVLVVYALLRLFPKTPPALACWLWRLVGLKFLLTLALGWLPPFSLPLLPVSEATAPVPTLVPDGPKIAPSVALAETTPPPSPVALTDAPKMPPVSPTWDWRTALLILYSAGVAFALTRAIRAVGATRRLARASIPADEEISRLAVELTGAMGLRRIPRLARTGETTSPLLAFGTVLLPKSAPPSDLQMMLAHELAHVRRRDLTWEWVGTATQILFWFHPLVLLARREERLARESAADALALQTTNAPAAAYGAMLLSLSVGPRRALAGAVGAAESGSLLRRRLTALGAASGGRRSRCLWGVAAAFGLVTLLSLIPWRLIPAQAQLPAPASAPSDPPVPANAAPKDGAELAAVITTTDGTPRANAPVRLRKWIKTPEGAYTMQDMAETTTDAKGRFRFAPLGPGEYYVHVDAPEGRREPALAFHVLLGVKGRTFTLQIPPTATVSGRLTYKGTSKPVVGARILGYLPLMPGPDPEDRRLALHSYADTDKDGRYTLPLAAGKAEVTVTVSPIISGQGFEYVEERKAKVGLRTGQTATQNFAVLPMAALKFSDLKGAPVEGVSVEFMPEDLGAPDSYRTGGTSDNNGIVFLRYFSSGTFRAEKGKLRANGTFHRDPDTGALSFRTETQKGTAADGRAAIFLTEVPSATLTGKVADEEGKPIPKVRLRLMELDPKSQHFRRDQVSTADAEGRFTLPLALDGEYELYVRADGYNQIAMFNDKAFTPTRGETKDVGTITLRKAEGVVSGEVVEEDGKPVAGALAFVQGGATYLSAAVTDTAGRFRIPNVVKNEELELTLCREGEARDSGDASMQSDEKWYRTGVKADDAPLRIVLRKNQRDARLPANAP